jgi:hypothetical protein
MMHLIKLINSLKREMRIVKKFMKFMQGNKQHHKIQIFLNILQKETLKNEICVFNFNSKEKLRKKN